MKKRGIYYIIAWVVVLAVFNVIVFAVPHEIAGYNRLTGSFWIGYAFIMLFFFGQLVCAWIALNGEKEKVFLNFPMITISITSLIVMGIVGTTCMTVPFIPNWVAIIGCVITLAFSVVALAGAKAAGEVVGDIDQKVKEQTFFIKSLTVDAQSLVNIANNEEIKTEAKKVFEAIKFSDPMSNEKLAMEEAQISSKFAEFSSYVTAGNVDEVKAKSSELLYLINNRNQKCKLFK